jgi:hypothetical protein
MNVMKSKECEKFKAQVNCPVPECTLKLHLFMDVKVMKNGFASRWVLSNFKKHINNHNNRIDALASCQKGWKTTTRKMSPNTNTDRNIFYRDDFF